MCLQKFEFGKIFVILWKALLNKAAFDWLQMQ